MRRELTCVWCVMSQLASTRDPVCVTCDNRRSWPSDHVSFALTSSSCSCQWIGSPCFIYHHSVLARYLVNLLTWQFIARVSCCDVWLWVAGSESRFAGLTTCSLSTATYVRTDCWHSSTDNRVLTSEYWHIEICHWRTVTWYLTDIGYLTVIYLDNHLWSTTCG